MKNQFPVGGQVVRIVLERLSNEFHWVGGFGVTCYECPFASDPLDSWGEKEQWSNIANDPAEAYFRCHLPGRDSTAVVWGEDAPCTRGEWAKAALDNLQ
jgi:hypothetical protein